MCDLWKAVKAEDLEFIEINYPDLLEYCKPVWNISYGIMALFRDGKIPEDIFYEYAVLSDSYGYFISSFVMIGLEMSLRIYKDRKYKSIRSIPSIVGAGDKEIFLRMVCTEDIVALQYFYYGLLANPQAVNWLSDINVKANTLFQIFIRACVEYPGLVKRSKSVIEILTKETSIEELFNEDTFQTWKNYAYAYINIAMEVGYKLQPDQPFLEEWLQEIDI